MNQQQPDLAIQMQKARMAATCAYNLPDRINGTQVYPEYVNVQYEPEGGLPVTLTRMLASSYCGSRSGWYEDPGRPGRVVLCPASCTLFQSLGESGKPPQLVIETGCPPDGN